MDLFIADKLRFVLALTRTVSIAVGNREYFGENGQEVSIALDIAVMELKRCCRVLEIILGNRKDTSHK